MAALLTGAEPREEAFFKVKAPLKKAAAHTKEALVEAIARSRVTVATEDARGCPTLTTSY